MSEIYVTDDGTWGNAQDLKIFSTENWTDEMFDAFDNEGDTLRMALAEHFTDENNHEFEVQMRPADHTEGNPLIPLNVCTVCDLSPSQLFPKEN